jgi:hypothetical protein
MPASVPCSDRRQIAFAARVRRLRRSKIRKNVEEWRERSERNDDLVEMAAVNQTIYKQHDFRMSGWRQDTKLTISRLPVRNFWCRSADD